MTKTNNRLPVAVYLLSLCNAYMYVGASLLITVSALIGFELAEDKRLATLPLAFQFFSIMCSSLPASLIMGRIGRKAGFLLAGAIGALGTLIAMWSIFNNSFWSYCIATICFGIFSGFGNYYRFTAVEVVSNETKTRAIAMVMAGGVIAAFIGPNLASWSSEIFSAERFAGPFLILMFVYFLSMLTISMAKLPKHVQTKKSGTGRPLLTIMAQPIFIVAVTCQMLGYGTMNFVMSSTPLAMHANHYALSETATVIQWHVLAMFAPSFITGHLSKSIGLLRVLTLGAVLGFVSIAINVLGDISMTNFVVSLVCLGVSWNFLYVGGTALLTDAYEPEEKVRVQGINDLFVFSTVTLTALTTGTIHHLLGWKAVNLLALPMLIAIMWAIIWLFLSQKRNETTPQKG